MILRSWDLVEGGRAWSRPSSVSAAGGKFRRMFPSISSSEEIFLRVDGEIVLACPCSIRWSRDVGIDSFAASCCWVSPSARRLSLIVRPSRYILMWADFVDLLDDSAN